MDSVYKKSLSELRKKKAQITEEDHRAVVYKVDWFYSSDESDEKVEVSEKTLVLDSFAQVVKEKMANQDSDTLKENGAIVSLKNNKNDNLSIEVQSADLSDLKSMIIEEFSESNFNLRYDSKNNIRVIFVSDFLFYKEDYENDEFNTLFSGDISRLFSNMVKAMKLPREQFFLSGIKANKDGKEKSFKDNLLREISYLKPELIITLGVSASHGLLNIKDRLKDIHGQFYDIEIDDHKTQIMPLFSPHLLGSAPNMKKIAWEDMQKAMKKLSL